MAMMRVPMTGKRPVGLVTPINVNNATDVSSWTISNHYSETGNIALLACWRSNSAASAQALTVTWDGAAVTARDSDSILGVDRGVAWCGTIRGGATATPAAPKDLVITLAASVARDIFGYLVDLPTTMPVTHVGGVNALVLNPAATDRHQVDITVQDAKSIVLGLICAYNSNCGPLSAASWNVMRRNTTGGGGNADMAGLNCIRTAGATGTLSLIGISVAGTTTDDWAGCSMEILP